MAKIFDTPFSSTIGSAKVSAIGIYALGAAYPNGIPNRLDIIDGALRSSLYKDDAYTNGGPRSEVEIGTFPTNSGTCWSTFDFMLPSNWSYTKLVMIGSWYPTYDGGDAAKHVTIGLRLLGTTFLVIVPDSLPSETDSGKTIARMDLERGRWYSLCIRVGLATDDTGFREVYVDGIPISREFNIPTTYVDAVGPYLKAGMYDGSHNNDYVTPLQIWLRNFKMWTGNEGFSSVLGTVPKLSGSALLLD